MSLKSDIRSALEKKNIAGKRSLCFIVSLNYSDKYITFMLIILFE